MPVGVELLQGFRTPNAQRDSFAATLLRFQLNGRVVPVEPDHGFHLGSKIIAVEVALDFG